MLSKYTVIFIKSLQLQYRATSSWKESHLRKPWWIIYANFAIDFQVLLKIHEKPSLGHFWQTLIFVLPGGGGGGRQKGRGKVCLRFISGSRARCNPLPPPSPPPQSAPQPLPSPYPHPLPSPHPLASSTRWTKLPALRLYRVAAINPEFFSSFF